LINGTIPGPVVSIGGASIMILGLIGANAIGVRWGSSIQNITVFAKIATLLLVTGLALFLGR
ncbi:MAG: amino acid permease, partial [Planctomycetales bacterium]|nr:amino acid permease [Planctomycetales bacterium]NIP71475.1 amino acid permease [Planctomycetales bacterium]